MTLYEYAVIYSPKKKKDGTYEQSPEIIIEPSTLLSETEQVALVLISRQIGDEWLDKLSEVQIIIRPFA